MTWLVLFVAGLSSIAENYVGLPLDFSRNGLLKSRS